MQHLGFRWVEAFIVTLLGVAQDLSEKKKYQQALLFSEERLGQVLRAADCLVWGAEVTLKAGDWNWQIQVEPSGLYQRLTGRPVPGEAGLWYHFEIPEMQEMNQRSRHAMEQGLAASGWWAWRPM